MKQIKEMLKNKKFYLYILITVVFFGIFCKIEYATDTYNVFETPFKNMFIHFISSGRFITAIAYMGTKVLHFSNNITYMLSFIFAIICTSISIYKLDKILSKDIRSKAISAITSILVIINIFSIELYLFIEKGILMLSVLFCVCAIEKLIKYFEGNKKSLIAVFIYMLLANFSYQGTVGLFVSIALIYIIKYAKNIKLFFKNSIITALCYGIPAIINYIIVRFVFTNNRVNGTNNFAQTIDKIIENSDYMITTTFEIIPKYLFITCVFILSLIIICCIIKENMNNKKKIWLIIGIPLIIIGNFIVTIFPQIMQNTDSIWFVPRSTYTFASLIGILLIYLFMNIQVNIRLEKALTIALIGYMCIQYVSFQNIARDRYIVNYMDRYIIMMIQEEIDNYEKETGNTITKIAFYEGKGKQYTYQNIFVNKDTNIKAFYPEWSRVKAITYYLNRSLEEVEGNEQIKQQYFINKEWKFYDNEQVVLVDDTIHMYLF